MNNYTNSNKFLLTQRELKGLEAQVIRSKHNLSIDIHVGKALIEENVYSLVKINNAAYRPLPFIRYSPFGSFPVI